MLQPAPRGFAPASVSPIRRITFYVCAALLALITCADFVSHALGFGAPHQIHVVVHEVVSATIIAAAASQLIAPRRFVAAAQALVVMFALAWALDALTLRFSGLGLILLLGLGVALTHPTRRAVFAFRGAFRPWLAALTALAAGPLLSFALGQAALQRADIAPIHASLGHWEWAAMWAAMLVALGLIAAAGARGACLVAWSAGFGAVAYGLASLLYPGEASAASQIWAIIAIAGGVVFVAVAEWDTRRAAGAYYAQRTRAAGPTYVRSQ